MCAVDAGTGNLPRVAHLTGNFTAQSQLSPAVISAISAALEQGWADPKKISQASHHALQLRQGAIADLADLLAIRPESIEVFGEPALIHHLSLGGFLRSGDLLTISGIDVGKIRAVARGYQGQSRVLAVGADGVIAHPSDLSPNEVISLQATNGETGISQDLDKWRGSPAKIILDATRAIPAQGLVDGFAAATFEGSTWNGPSGIGILVINDEKLFQYPFAHIAPIRTPGSYSLPLLIGNVVALHEYRNLQEHVFSLRDILSRKLAIIPGVQIIGASDIDSQYLSIVVDSISGEEVLRSLAATGINCDAGSACSPEDLAPSHVIAAMGYETTGHLRFTVHPTTTETDIELLVSSLKKVIADLGR